MKIINESGNPRMSVLGERDLETLEKFIQIVDKGLVLSSVDYDKGLICVGMTYNRGTSEEWVEEDFIVVNVACDSVAAACKDVYSAAYARCM